MLKKIGLVSISLVATLAFIAAGALIVDRMQRSQDQEALAQTVESNSSLKILKNQKAIERQVACKPNGNGATDCPALLYKISKQECSELQSMFGVDKKWCGHNTRLNSDGRNIEVRFGQVYEQSDGNLYLTVVMNERNLLSF